MKKIVMLFSMSFFPNQGRYIRVYNQAKTLVDNGYDVTIIAWDRECLRPKEEIVDGIKIERIWLKAGIERGPILNGAKVLVFSFKAFWRLMKREFDLVECFNLDTVIPGILAARLKRKRAVMDLCEPDYYAFWSKAYTPFLKLVNWIEKFLSKRFNYLLVHNLYQMRKFSKYGVKNLEQIGTYPNKRIIIDEIKKKAGDEEVIIGRIGTIYADNGIEELVEAFKIFSSRSKRAKLFFAGRVYDHYKPVFKGLVEPLGEKVELVGSFSPDQMSDLYARIDISLMLNRRSDWFIHITPTKFFDSLANGVPVIASDIGDLRELSERYQCGIIVDETDPDDICRALELLVKDKDMRRRMGENGLRLVKEQYNWELMGKSLLKIYDDLLNERPGNRAEVGIEG